MFLWFTCFSNLFMDNIHRKNQKRYSTIDYLVDAAGTFSPKLFLEHKKPDYNEYRIKQEYFLYHSGSSRKYEE